MDPDIVMHQYLDNQHGGSPYHESVGTFLWIVYSRNQQQDTVAYVNICDLPTTSNNYSSRSSLFYPFWD